MNIQPSIIKLLTAAESMQIRFWPQGGNVHYRCPTILSAEMKEQIIANKQDLIAFLATWQSQESNRLQERADGQISSFGVSGCDPVIQEAARLCVEASHRSDMAGVRKGCALVEDRARKLAEIIHRVGATI